MNGNTESGNDYMTNSDFDNFNSEYMKGSYSDGEFDQDPNLNSTLQNDNINPDDNQELDNLNISFNIPGAFKNNDMEIDDSPPFTIESDLYFDSNSQNTNYQPADHRGESLFPHNQYFNRQQFLNSIQSGTSISSQNLNQNAASTPTPSANLQFDTPTSTTQGIAYDQYDNNSIYSSFLNDNEVSSFNNDHMRNASIDGSQYQHQNPPSLSINPGNPNSLNIGIYQNYDLSPLTTTTSLTPSINSLHSNQPSFFSAHQYLPRRSIEVSNSHRNSIDATSLNSHNQQSKRNISGRYLNFNTISNYIPFMNDKDKTESSNGRHHSEGSENKSPMSGGPHSPLSQTPTSLFSNQSQTTPRPPSKHLIRSIFKSNPMSNNTSSNSIDENSNSNPSNNPTINITSELGPGMSSHDFMGDEGFSEEYNSEFLMMSPPMDDTDDTNVPSKKSRKPKRSLFNRFKTPSKPEELNGEPEIETSSKASANNSFNHEEDMEDNFQANMSRTPSSANTVRTNTNGVNPNLDVMNSNNSSNGYQPDYAALFENVGKRKNKKVSKPSNSLSFAKTKKSKRDNLDLTMESENSSFVNHDNKSSKSFDSGSISVSTSNTSHSQNPNGTYHSNMDENGYDDEEDDDFDEDSTLASASKRILGSKLMKRKTSKKEADIKNVKTKIISEEGVEVEVDLKTLDLPNSTEVVPNNAVNAKTSIRGRKENKEADLTDSSKIYLCNYCSRRFKRQEHLKRHFRSLHTFEKPYDCDICHKKFSRSDNLNQHLKIHKQEEEDKLRAEAEAGQV